MALTERLSEYVRACFTGIWIKTFEADDALAEIARLCRQQGWGLASWDIDRGLSLAGHAADTTAITGGADPLAAIRALNALATTDGTRPYAYAEADLEPFLPDSCSKRIPRWSCCTGARRPMQRLSHGQAPTSSPHEVERFSNIMIQI
jgi:hypothetical protein